MPIFQGGNDPRKEGGLSYDACPLERSGTEEDFAGAVLYVMSPAGAYLNGKKCSLFLGVGIDADGVSR